MPVLLLFGLYHLLTWFNVFGINRRLFWKRVGLTSALSHIILALGFFLFSYFDYSMNSDKLFAGVGFDRYLFDQSEFWRLMLIFDTAPMVVLLAVFAIMARMEWNPPILVALAMTLTLVAGTLQWYFVGGAIGLLVERFWSGLKSGDDMDEDWL